MDDGCFSELGANIVFNCADAPKKGIANSKAVILNFFSIDRAASVENGATISSIVLQDGATGRSLNWFKDLANDNNTFVPNTEDIDGFKNSFLTRLPNSSAENSERAHELKNGRFIVVYESNYKGADSKDAFKVLGWENGLTLEALTNATNENSGSSPFTLGSEEGGYEQYPYRVFLQNDDYAESKASFDSLFAVV